MSAELEPVATAPGIEQASRGKAEELTTSYLTKAKSWLILAVDATSNVSASQIKDARAEIYTVKEATKQRDLSKDIQQDAAEMARRADYALGKAIRDGQERGEIRRNGQSGGGEHVLGVRGSIERSSFVVPTKDDPQPMNTLATEAELYGDKRGAESNGILALADNADPDEFEQALASAKEERNLSRANVARKVRASREQNVVIEPDEPEHHYRTEGLHGYVPPEIPEPSKPHTERRKPWTDLADAAILQLDSAVKAIEALAKDDRFPKYKGDATKTARYIALDRDALSRVIDQFN